MALVGGRLVLHQASIDQHHALETTASFFVSLVHRCCSGDRPFDCRYCNTARLHICLKGLHFPGLLSSCTPAVFDVFCKHSLSLTRQLHGTGRLVSHQSTTELVASFIFTIIVLLPTIDMSQQGLQKCVQCFPGSPVCHKMNFKLSSRS